MLAHGGREHSRGRRVTALAVACAFLLMGGFAAFHRHGPDGEHHLPIASTGAPTITSADGATSDTPESCVACFWSRSATAGVTAGRPHLPLPMVVRLHPGNATIHPCRPTLAGCPSRAPPTPSA